jgi:hypothetical protein
MKQLKSSHFPSVQLCVFSVFLCETYNYTELHREDTELHRENMRQFKLFHVKSSEILVRTGCVVTVIEKLVSKQNSNLNG